MQSPMRKGTCCLLVAVALFTPLAAWCFKAIKVSPEKAVRQCQQFLLPGQCQPEPAERTAFLLGLAVVPSTLFGLGLVSRRLEQRVRLQVPPAALWTLELVGALLLVAGCWYAATEESYFHIQRSFLVRFPVAGALLLALLIVALWRLQLNPQMTQMKKTWLLRGVYHLPALGLAAALFCASLFNEGGVYSAHPHFTATFNPVVQVYLGKALLINCSSQYGLYAHFLQPLFALSGLSVLKFTLVMGVLTAASFLAVWAFLSRTTHNGLVALLGFFALVFSCWFYCKTPDHGTPEELDLYFQYFPIRFVFPAFLLPLTWKYLHRPTRRWYWGTMVFLAAGVLWNLDAGLPTYVTWLALLGFAECFGLGWLASLGRVAGHLGRGTLALAGVTGCYAALIWCRYGEWPHFAQVYLYQKVFYGAGFCMLPMPLHGTWMIVIGIYLGGLAYALLGLTAGTNTVHVKLTFLVSVLGLGLFTYYQGRSHPIVLTLVWWPAFVLLTLFLDGLVRRLRAGSRQLLEWVAALLVLGLLAGNAAALVANARVLKSFIARQFPRRGGLRAQVLKQDALVLKQAASPGEPLMVLSTREALLHLQAGIPSIAPCSYIEMVLVSDLAKLQEAFDRHPAAQIFWENQFGDHITSQLNGYMVAHEFEVVGRTASGPIYQKGEFLLNDRDPPLWHIGFKDGTVGGGLETHPVALGRAFTLEVILKPSAAEAARAAVVGNHPGLHHHEGFVLCHRGDNVYELILGDGRQWHTVLEFPLEPDYWHYLAIRAEGDTVQAYVNGQLVATGSTAGFELHNSLMPLDVGNWTEGDRPFRGRIKEARLLDQALAASAIADQCVHFPN